MASMERKQIYANLLKLVVVASVLSLTMVKSEGAESVDGAQPVIEPSKFQTTALAEWENMKYGMFIHYGMSTFTGAELDRGTAPSKTYAPSDLDICQWVSVAKQAGMEYAVLVTKHTSGHCLWDSKGYDYDVQTSGDTTDVVEEFVKECNAKGIKPGFYYNILESYSNGVNLSHRWATPISDEYFGLIKHHITELHTRHKGICEQWFDIAAKLSSAQRWELYRLVKSLNPECVVVMNQGYNDGKRFPIWVWPTDIVNGERMGPSELKHNPVKYTFDGRKYYLPMEVADSLSEHWFWVPNDKLKSVKQLYTMWQLTVERGANLLLNVTPDTSGRIPQEQVERLLEFKRVLDNRDLLSEPQSLTYAMPACASNEQWNPAHRCFAAFDDDYTTFWLTEGPVRVAWLEVDLCENRSFQRAKISEFEDRIELFELQIQRDGTWQTISQGDKIGKNLELTFEPVSSRFVRLNIVKANNSPGIHEFQLYDD